ncbi:MAG: SAM-dependent methyltransferase, partial [Acidimicrobiales bacterium]
ATATEAMAALDFFPVGPGTPAALTATVRVYGHIDFIRRRAATSRIRLQWADSDVSRSAVRRLAGRLHPTTRDLELVALPDWAWPGYWPLRGVRLARDRYRNMVSGDDGGLGADLGIFLGTPPALIGPLLEFAGLRRGETVIDLGCGDGRVLIEAADRFGCSARGYETDRDLVDRARAAAEQAGVGQLVEVIHGDAMEAPIDDADVVFAFLPPDAVVGILEPTLDRLTADARFLSHEQLASAWPTEPDRSGLLIGPTGAGGGEPAEGGVTVANLWFGRRG